MPVCLIGLGSNQGNRRAILEAAAALLADHPRIEVLAQSSPRETAAVGGPKDQPPFLNGALKLETSLRPRELLDCLQRIEIELGRRRGERWGPRTIDLDLLLYGEQTLDSPELTLPHPRMAWRRFVLEPAAEIAGEMIHPTVCWNIARLLEHIDTTPPYIAITGGIAAGKSRLAERLAEELPARLIEERPDWKRLESFYADPPASAWATEIGFLNQRIELMQAAKINRNSRELTASGELPLSADNTQNSTDDHPGAVSPRLLEDVEKSGRWSVSDFWFDQSAAFARAWLLEEKFDEYAERFERLAANVARPRLIVLLDEPGDTLLDRVRQRGRNCERRLTAEQLDRIRREVAARAALPGTGPVLRSQGQDHETILAEALAAAKATE
ncbi:MAG: 2-amino-4-hydroxy-6-hydroxymethyldihydropteridine diphosphokinase [Pirellulaceae bacterium]|nr:2-amino-4-hydroxy-6-hydroxymethyldihydropteridine diphosphokinase [Pirellulaceae bacterium]